MKNRTNIYLRPDQTKQLKALSKKTGSSAAELVRRAVDEYLEKENVMELKFDKRGKVIPDAESLIWAAREHANKSDAEKYRYAQAHTFLKVPGIRDQGPRKKKS